MRWQGNRQSDNVEDRRGSPRGPVMVGGGIFTLIVIVVLLFMGVDPQALLQNMPQQPGGGQVRPAARSIPAADRRRVCPRARTRKPS